MVVWIRKIAEYILIIPFAFPFLLKLTITIGLPVCAILFFGFHPGGNSPEAYSITLSLEKKLLLGSILALCSLPWVAMLSVRLIDKTEKSRRRSDPEFLDSTKQKFESGEAELDFHEIELLTEDIQSRLRLNGKVSVEEYAFYILQNQSHLDDFLYESDNETFYQILHYFALHMNDVNFRNVVRYMKSLIPNRLENVLRKGVLSDQTIRRIYASK